MANEQRIRKLSIGPSEPEPVKARDSCAGMLVIADYIDPLNRHRTLVLERVGWSATKARTKSKGAPPVENEKA